MTNAELILKLQALDPGAPAQISIKDAAGQTSSMPVLWIAKGSIYGKAATASYESPYPPAGVAIDDAF